MTTLERNLLKTVRKNLIYSSTTNWTRGDHDQWLIYARSMQNAIGSQVRILETLISEETNPIKKDEQVIDNSEII